jgi:hypothetical protein
MNQRSHPAAETPRSASGGTEDRLQDFLTVENIVLVLGVVGSLASIIALVQATRSVFKHNRWLAAFEMILFIVLSAGSAAAIYYWNNSRVAAEEARARSRITGLLHAAQTEIAGITRSLELGLETGKSGLASPIVPQPPEVYKTLLSSGDIYSALSPELQERLAQFIKTNNTYAEGFRIAAQQTNEPQLGTYHVMLHSYLIQDIFIGLELLFQSNKLSAEELSARQKAASEYEVQLLMLMPKGWEWVSPARKGVAGNLDDADRKAVYCIGQEFDSIIAIANAAPPLNDADQRKLDRADADFRDLGIPLRVSDVARRTKKDSEDYKSLLSLLEIGLFATHGQTAYAAFALGQMMLPALNDFERYRSDPEFHEKNFDRVMKGEVFEINSLIGVARLPGGLTKGWPQLFTYTYIGQGGTPDLIPEWRQRVRNYCVVTG